MTKNVLMKIIRDELKVILPEVKVQNKHAEQLISTVVAKMQEELINGNSVIIPEIGTIKTKVQKGRTGTLNFGPKKGEKFKTEDKTVLTISQSVKIAEKL